MIPNIKITTPSGYMTSDCLSEEFLHRRIYISGEITDITAFEICCQINQLASINNEDIIIWIQSQGGSVTAGLAIIDTMKTCGCDICTVVMGNAASMGAVISSSGTKGKRFVGLSAEVMIHQAIGGVSGQTTDILRTAKHISKVNNRLYSILAENTGKNIEQISNDCDRDYFLNAEESIKYGLADHIFTGFNTLNT